MRRPDPDDGLNTTTFARLVAPTKSPQKAFFQQNLTTKYGLYYSLNARTRVHCNYFVRLFDHITAQFQMSVGFDKHIDRLEIIYSTEFFEVAL